ncbi:transcriptional regulator, ArsR family [Beutenbergia cavernae DSM 12333]|uniref:Transcriptional regulator, ArsR family n=1 Tax=Beutenbergia cavernae (strain ATCC BAA-8 / DSM 12333 / CCUG 43141 / JCM 11478 / NBRC 16432 / NCIMB 13614 / HKI 0122) TaxID=471853 RepID=C5BZ97_BEUC1|nr:transcriptional regulator, ArsR family [Beutenbergia cavernae DSM 12333]
MSEEALADERDADAKALASTLRLRIIRLVKDTPLTNQQMADALGVPPATLLHHVRLLVERGFLESLPVRRGARGSRERPYLSTGKSWRSPSAPGTTRTMVQTFLDEFALAGGEAAMMTRLGVRLTPEHRDELRRRLNSLFQEYADRDDDVDGEPLSLFFAMHADVSRARAEASSRGAGSQLPP